MLSGKMFTVTMCGTTMRTNSSYEITHFSVVLMACLCIQNLSVQKYINFGVVLKIKQN